MAAATAEEESAATLRGRAPSEQRGPPGVEARQKRRLLVTSESDVEELQSKWWSDDLVKESGPVPQDPKFKNAEETGDCFSCMQDTQHLQQRKEKHLQQNEEREQGRKAPPKGGPQPYTTLKEAATHLEAERRVQTMACLFERQANRDAEVAEWEKMHQTMQQREREKKGRTAEFEHKGRELKGQEHKSSQQAPF
ncbi:hypothetical protein NDU88_004317 [Pleurodeles waltl]|uniref:Uncharacterized protein n=1 Tax=Pleurodeles waltl TaxID=8319 RepID=A0AAV7V0U0_PLEWA|nr:hypothetical protein NDU88_004317 [Pleurodeles waltl]